MKCIKTLKSVKSDVKDYLKNMKLFPKTFLHCLVLMVGVVVLAFAMIYALLPTFYRNYKQQELNTYAETLAQKLEQVNYADLGHVISNQHLQGEYGLTLTNAHGTVICYYVVTSVSYQGVAGGFEDGNMEISVEIEMAQSEKRFITADGQPVTLYLQTSLQPIEDALSVLLVILPIVLLLCVLLSAVAAYFYAQTITKPIQSITAATVAMQTLAPDVSCEVRSADEIGVLAENINTMYQNLLSSIADLEQEIQIVSRAEQEKLDFLLLASHELKTPVTAVRGMVDGMIYRVGVYKDRDTYLKECQKRLEELTELLCRILETSRIDAATAAKDKTETDVGELVESVLSPYRNIAQSRGIALTFTREEDFTAVIPPELVGKALSNVISNAVKYTDEGRRIGITVAHRRVTVENECEPLSPDVLEHLGEPFYHPSRQNAAGDSTGLGLYFTDRILSACELSFTFAPYKGGMRFVLEF